MQEEWGWYLHASLTRSTSRRSMMKERVSRLLTHERANRNCTESLGAGASGWLGPACPLLMKRRHTDQLYAHSEIGEQQLSARGRCATSCCGVWEPLPCIREVPGCREAGRSWLSFYLS
eukprot:6475716-Amphidinium_carterae.1